MSNLTSDLVSRLHYLADQANDSVPWRELRDAATEIERLQKVETNLRASYSKLSGEHCRDCCCAKSWKALRVTEYTGLSIPEHIEALRATLERYMFAYPAFRMKPIGEPGSPARIESERLMALEETAQRVLAGGEPGA